MRKLVFTFLICSMVIAIGCNKKTPANEKRYEFQGRVVSVDKATREITVAHKDIPGYMKGMTMPFKVKQDWALGVAKPGDTISAQLVVTDEDAALDNITLTQRSANAPPDAEGLHLPEAGELVPNFAFTDQNGKPVSLNSLRGGPVLLTFIYTRCPLPDYCIRMSNNFGQIAKTLKADPKIWKQTHLLSISFDPEDTPKALKDYGKSYAGDVDPKFEQWKFLTAKPDEVKKAADYFGLLYDKQSGQYIHSLRTALIDKDGKLVKVVRGNEWTAPDMAKELSGMAAK